MQDLLQDEAVVQVWYGQISEQETMLKILATAEETEHLMDLLNQRFASESWFRLILLQVAATIPRVEEPPKEEVTPGEEEAADLKKQERISREELYEAVKDMAHLTRVYLGMVVLSTVVAAVGP